MGFHRSVLNKQKDELYERLKELEDDMFIVRHDISHRLLSEKHAEYLASYKKIEQQLESMNAARN